MKQHAAPVVFDPSNLTEEQEETVMRIVSAAMMTRNEIIEMFVQITVNMDRFKVNALRAAKAINAFCAAQKKAERSTQGKRKRGLRNTYSGGPQLS